MKILTAAEMHAADQATVEAGTPFAELMEQAGAAVASYVLLQYPQAARVMVLCGKGNNGGDGLVAARLLAGEGIGIRVLLVGRQADVKDVAAEALAALREATDEGIVEEFTDETNEHLEAIVHLLSEADLLIDAVTGTGFQGALRGPAAVLQEAVAASAVPVLAVDLPSGWEADSHAQDAPGAFRANAVISFTAPKPAHVFGHLTQVIFGPVVVAEIGTPEDLIRTESGLHWAGSAKTLTEVARPINSNKGKFGHVLIVGGSYGTAGAPSMAALACLRAGAGLVTAAVPRSVVNLVAAAAPELMLRPLAEDEEGVVALSNLTALDDLLKGIKVLAIGPGLSTRGEASAFARGLIAQTTLPVVIDADALNAYDAEHVTDLNGRAADGSLRTMVLTPHPGEFARLLGKTVPEVEADRINLARSFATSHQVTLVLKGWRTLIAHADGSMAVNTTGNPGLAKGGSGDTLTGIIAAMLAQHPADVAGAVEAAVYLHGLAADLAVQDTDEKALLASDVISHISAAFRHRNQDAEGNTWLCGLAFMAAAKEQP